MQVVGLTKSDLVKPEKYPRFTLLGQAYGSVVLTYEALSLMVPEVSHMADTVLAIFTGLSAKIFLGSIITYHLHVMHGLADVYRYNGLGIRLSPGLESRCQGCMLCALPHH